MFLWPIDLELTNDRHTIGLAFVFLAKPKLSPHAQNRL